MAKATKRTVTKPVHMIRLELSMDESRALQTVLRCVGGDPQTSSRAYIDAISMELTATIGQRFNDNTVMGIINFRDTIKPAIKV